MQKEDPDHFANQVRIKNSMYDAQVLELQQCESVFRRPRQIYDVRRRPRIFKIIRSFLDLRANIQYRPLLVKKIDPFSKNF